MLFRIVRPVKRSDSSNAQFVQRIPADVMAKAVGQTLCIPLGDSVVLRTISPKMDAIKLSLRTSSPSEVKLRHIAVAAYLEKFWDALRNGPTTLSQKQCVAVAGRVFHRFTKAVEDNPGSAKLWDRVAADNSRASKGAFGVGSLMIDKQRRIAASLEDRFGRFADVELADAGLVIDAESRAVVLHHVAKAMENATDRAQRWAEGDYGTQAYESRFPALETSTPSTRIKGDGVGIRELLEGWWREAQAAKSAKPSTYDSYRRTVENLIKFLSHDSANQLSPEDIVRFKDHRLEAGVSAKTVNSSDLSALKTVFGWAVRNHKMPSNPADGIAIKQKKKASLRPKGFTDDEALSVLKQCVSYTASKRERAKLALAKKWVPWLCAFTGARVGEMLQLRKSDVQQKDGHWIVHITPEAGTVKDDEPRDVVLHQQLLELGFLALVEQSGHGYLFISPTAKGGVLAAIKTTRNKIGTFVRQVVTDDRIKPNHAWRHRFKTVGRELGIEDSILDAIEGHAANTVGGRYGDVTIKTQAVAIAKYPLYKV